ncbi:hypothetical protein O0L34_g11500 [Tuta absoluta]|nr:hypothetical protein O0L34_g11500 [Tuta absoluta]
MAFSLVMILFVASILIVWWYYMLDPKAIATTTTTNERTQQTAKGGDIQVQQLYWRRSGELGAPAETNVEGVVNIAAEALSTALRLTIFSTYRPTPVENAICEQFITDKLYYPLCLKIIEDCLKMGKRITLSPRNVPGCF